MTLQLMTELGNVATQISPTVAVLVSAAAVAVAYVLKRK